MYSEEDIHVVSRKSLAQGEILYKYLMLLKERTSNRFLLLIVPTKDVNQHQLIKYIESFYTSYSVVLILELNSKSVERIIQFLSSSCGINVPAINQMNVDPSDKNSYFKWLTEKLLQVDGFMELHLVHGAEARKAKKIEQ